MTEKRIDDHTIWLEPAPAPPEPVLRNGYSHVDGADESWSCAMTNCSGVIADPKPVDRGYYRRTFGK